jgi:hypothetical protein
MLLAGKLDAGGNKEEELAALRKEATALTVV